MPVVADAFAVRHSEEFMAMSLSMLRVVHVAVWVSHGLCHQLSKRLMWGSNSTAMLLTDFLVIRGCVTFARLQVLTSPFMFYVHAAGNLLLVFQFYG